MSHPIAVVGAGLSGLYASYLLQQSGHRVLLIEARDRMGGRVLSQAAHAEGHRLDLGPAWFWPGMNPRMSSLVKQMGLASFPQHARGAAVVEGQDGKLHKHQSAWEQTPASYRIAGGMQSLSEALHARFDDSVHLKTHTRVRGFKLRPHAVELELEDASGQWSQLATHVIVTIPRVCGRKMCRLSRPGPKP